ncbi:hypothetical protein BCR34DRAFT_596509 [Clohesyomyces aquaticus]|uniref:Uncharacterized protein n=1 Tax=Clohesyomyces aquaticus TaxID=1231657 RepID=A0A1Y2A5Y6_9PLEO|nr:hypothetical protein BCR34DRAFT_596509 [Clohesyomyces aquaticus]
MYEQTRRPSWAITAILPRPPSSSAGCLTPLRYSSVFPYCIPGPDFVDHVKKLFVAPSGFDPFAVPIARFHIRINVFDPEELNRRVTRRCLGFEAGEMPAQTQGFAEIHSKLKSSATDAFNQGLNPESFGITNRDNSYRCMETKLDHWYSQQVGFIDLILSCEEEMAVAHYYLADYTRIAQKMGPWVRAAILEGARKDAEVAKPKLSKAQQKSSKKKAKKARK